MERRAGGGGMRPGKTDALSVLRSALCRLIV